LFVGGFLSVSIPVYQTPQVVFPSAILVPFEWLSTKSQSMDLEIDLGRGYIVTVPETILCMIFTQHTSICLFSFFTKSLKYHTPYDGGARGGVVFKVLRYKQAGRGFDSRWCH